MQEYFINFSVYCLVYKIIVDLSSHQARPLIIENLTRYEFETKLLIIIFESCSS